MPGETSPARPCKAQGTMPAGRSSPRTSRLLLVSASLALALAGCSAEAKPARDDVRAVALPAGIGEPPAVLAIAVNPADGAVFLRTRSGVLRVPPDGRSAELLQGSLIGGQGSEPLEPELAFTFVGPDHLLGSGHARAGSGGSPDLGLIESTDGGLTWSAVAYQGKADLHLIRARGPGLTAYDIAGGRLLSTTDRGQTWRRRAAPGLLSDMAVDPADARHLIAVSERGALETRDGGMSWRPAGGDIDLLAWPSAKRLFLVDATGSVKVSEDSGASSHVVGSLGARPRALAAQDGKRLWAATERGVLSSPDGGVTWTERFRLSADGR